MGPNPFENATNVLVNADFGFGKSADTYYKGVVNAAATNHQKLSLTITLPRVIQKWPEDVIVATERDEMDAKGTNFRVTNEAKPTTRGQSFIYPLELITTRDTKTLTPPLTPPEQSLMPQSIPSPIQV